MVASACTQAPVKPYEGQVYFGNSMSQAIMRSGDSVKCNDPKFDNYICMPVEDFEDFVSGLLKKGN